MLAIRPDDVRADPAAWRGPTDFSNWVVQCRVLAGAYPGHRDNIEKHKHLIDDLLAAGVTTFVCLQLASELVSFRPYHDTVLEVWKQRVQLQQKAATSEPKFLHFPIPDHSITKDEDVLAFTDELVSRFHNGEVMYIHCWGGHGRTGTIVACLLARLYGLRGVEGAETALQLTSALHSCRVNTRGSSSPQSACQFEQVRRLVGGW